MRQRNTALAVLLWVALLLLLVWLWRSHGVDAVSGVLGVLGAVVALIPFLPDWLKLGPPPAPSTAAQVSAGGLQFAEAVRLQWEAEAKRRRMADQNEMPVRWRLRQPGLDPAARRLQLGPEGELDELLTAYLDRPPRLVVIGDPGAGKTGFCLKLVLAMAERPAALRIPVLLPIADWDPADLVGSWLERRIAQDYPFLGNEAAYGGTVVRSLLEQDRILLLFDGLDELPADRQAEAVQRLRDDLRASQPFVLTCRTREFAALGAVVFHGFTTVELLAMRGEAAADYLEEVTDGDFLAKWRPVTQRLKTDPGGTLAAALTLPLNLFLAGVAYEPIDREPGELLEGRFGSRAEIEAHLLDAFIPTVFRERAEAESSVDIPRPRIWPSRDVERWLRFLAGYLRTRRTQELAWWRLADTVPRAFRTAWGAGGGALGCAALGALLFGIYRQPLLGLLLGLAVGAVGGFGFSLIGSDEPRRMAPRPPTRADLAPHLLVRDFGFAVVGVIVGGLIVGILYGRVYGAAVGAIFGVAFGLVRRLSRPTEPRIAVNPENILRADRAAVLLSAAFGGVIGALVGAFLLGVIGTGAGHDPVSLGSPLLDALLGVGAGFVTGAGGLGMLVHSTSAWGRLAVARSWLALTGRGPWRLMTFLEDAHDRGVLRHVGPYYQFRHSALKDRLLDPQASSGGSGVAAT